MFLSSVKNQVHNLPPRTKLILLFGLVALVGLIVLHFAFIYNYSNAHPRSDQWRHIKKIIIPWNNGEVSTKIFWSNHHPNPLLHFYQIFIAGPLFDWDVRKDAYFALTLHVLIYLALVIATLRLAKEKSHPFLAFGLIATGLYFLFFQTTLTWVWTLVSLQSLGYVFGIAMLVILSCFGTTRRDLKVSFALSAITVLTVLLNFDYGVIFFLSAFGSMTLVTIFHRDKALFKQMFVYAGIAVAGILLIKIALLPEGKEKEGASIASLILSSPDLVKAYFYSISSAFWGESWFRKFTIHGSGVILPALSIAATTFIFLAAALAALSKGRRGLLMLGLMIYSALFSLAVFTARDAGDFTVYLSASRYATNFKLSWVGAFLALTLFAAEAVKFMPRRYWAGLTALVMLVVLLSGGFASQKSWEKGKNLRAAYDRDELMVYILGTDPDADYRLPRSIVGSNSGFDESLDYLVQNKFSVFSPNYRSGPLLAEYKILRPEAESRASKTFKIGLDSTKIPAKMTERVDLCIDLNGLSIGAPVILDIDHFNDDRIHSARLRLRGEGYKSVLSALPGQTRHYINPGLERIKVCSWAEVKLIED